ncbi:MAG TPA: pteridine-dependent deoxygenase [Rhodanobacteraceae bacterium]|nr:pteridine-dependent deoxygenase [Rhodanobacteraceae bacterium]
MLVGLSALRVAYRRESAQVLLDRSGTLAVFSFDGPGPAVADPRHLRVPLSPFAGDPPRECWSVDAEVATGSAAELRWAAGGGWRVASIEIDEAHVGGIRAASERAYELLIEHVRTSPECHLQRVWNYLDAINAGTGDTERYRLFCSGRARGLAAHAVTRYPAATAIGHHGPRGLLQVYALSAAEPGAALENPRQVSAWKYPREYGPTAPSFARAMRLPNSALAISGTAAVIGHASHHRDDIAAQANETFANLDMLLERAGKPAFDAGSPLKVYVRHREDADAVRAALASHLDPSVPCVLLHGDICRRELLVEIDGWNFSGVASDDGAPIPAG